MIFSRTNLGIGQSRAKNCEESAGNVRFNVAPQKPSKNVVKRAFETKTFRTKFFRRGKMKCWGSSETRFRKVSKRTEPCLRGKRSFEIFEFVLSFFSATHGTKGQLRERPPKAEVVILERVLMKAPDAVLKLFCKSNR